VDPKRKENIPGLQRLQGEVDKMFLELMRGESLEAPAAALASGEPATGDAEMAGDAAASGSESDGRC
jgi:hypothetical protein